MRAGRRGPVRAQVPAASITRADVAGQLSRIANENGRYASNRARAALSALFAWAIAEGLVETNPVIGTRKATEEKTRDRVLTDDELALIWTQTSQGDFGAIIRLLILTGQRREEVAAMTWPEINFQTNFWMIEANRTKNGRANQIFLSEAASNILINRLRSIDRDLVFGSRGPFSGWSKAKKALDARIAALNGGNGLKEWRVHDIRRTVATRMAELGVLPHVVEAVLNHMSGHQSGVAGVYNHASYLPEKMAAARLWADHVAFVVNRAR